MSSARYAALGDESASASAIQLEDQECTKNGGHLSGRQVFSTHDMVRKIRIAIETRTNPAFLIVACTEARTTCDFDEALRRAHDCAIAGADVLYSERSNACADISGDRARRWRTWTLRCVMREAKAA